MKKFSKKFYKSFNLVNYIKYTNFFFIVFDREFKIKLIKKTLNFDKLKIPNFQSKKIFKISIKKTILPLINNSTVFIKPFNKKTLLFNNFYLFFT